jgi:hypothetical protein
LKRKSSAPLLDERTARSTLSHLRRRSSRTFRPELRTVRSTLAPACLSVAFFALLALGAAPALAAPPASFGTEGEGAGQLSSPVGVAVEQGSGDVYVADRFNNRVSEFGPEGEFMLAIGWGVLDGSSALQVCGPEAPTPTAGCRIGVSGSGAGQFGDASGIAVDNDPSSASHGDVYVLDVSNLRVEKFGPQGEFLLMFGGGVDQGPNHPGNLCTAAFIAGGDTCGAGVSGSGGGEFVGLEGKSIAVDSAGDIYVGDEDRIQRFGPGGAVEAQILLPGVGFPNSLAVDSAGDLYVHSFGLSGVHKYDAAGTELGEPRDVGIGAGAGAALGSGESLFVSGEDARINEYASSGTQLSSFGAGLNGASGIAYGEGLEVVYLLESGSVRIAAVPSPGPYVLPGSETASELQPTTATLGATVNPEGPEATSYFFEYGTAAAYGEQTASTGLAGGPFEDQPAAAALTGLEPSTTYHYRVVATNAAHETTEGPDQTFETLPPVSIESTSASGVSAESATLETILNPHGLATGYRFEYGPTTAYGTAAPIPDEGIGAGTVGVARSLQISGLKPATTYHYRVVAHNALGLVLGEDHQFTTQGTLASLLPDDRAWELVSPPNKNGGALLPITELGGIIQSSADGSSLAYVSNGPLGTEPAGVRTGVGSVTQQLATRGATGWSSQGLATPHHELTEIVAGNTSEYKQFAEDLSAAVVEPEGATPLSPKTVERTPYRREANGEYVPLLTDSNVLPGSQFGGEETGSPLGKSGHWANGVEYRLGTPDLRHLLLTSTHLLAPGFREGFEAGRANIYELSGSRLQLVSTLSDGEPAAEAGLEAVVGRNNINMRNAISTDGNLVFFETVGGHLYAHDLALDRSVQLDVRQAEAAGGPDAPSFQGASADGSRVFFTDPSRLTKDSTAAPNRPDLYMCQMTIVGSGPACTLSDLTVDPNAGESADVQGSLSGIDAVGDELFFAANGVLTDTPNQHGERAVPGACASQEPGTCNLYAYDVRSGETSLVAVVSNGDDPDWAGRTNLHELGNLTARISPDGRYFAFMSQRRLTGYDNRDAVSGEPDAEVYLFDSATNRLTCASCDPTGALPRGIYDSPVFPGPLVDHPRSWHPRWIAASIPGWTLSANAAQTALYQSRYLSNQGRLFFNSSDGLVPQDSNGLMDVYEYEPPQTAGAAPPGDTCTTSSSTYGAASGGCVSLISSGSSSEESAFLDASENGEDVFFLTASKLSGRDTDSALDVYDARVGGGEAEVPAANPCSGEACQAAGAVPAEASPTTSSFSGPGNPVSRCAKGKVRKGGKCVAKQKPKKHKPRKSKSSHKKRQDGKHRKTQSRPGARRGGAK